MMGVSKTTIDDFDAIGFDLDHWIAQYKLPAYFKLSFDSIAMVLVGDYGYPQEIFPENTNKDSPFFKYGFRGVIEYSTLNIIKLGAKGEILRVYKGYENLPKEKIIEIYGKNPVIKNFDLNTLKSDGYYFISDLSVFPVSLVILQIAELLKNKGKYPDLEEKSGEEIMDDIWKAGYYLFEQYKESNTAPINSGYYYPFLCTNQKKYLSRIDDELVQKLFVLKSLGKILFLVINPWAGHYEAVMSEVFRDAGNPLDIFDYIGMGCLKPLFFTGKSQFERVDLLKGNNIPKPHSMNFDKDRVFVRGNASDLTEHFKTKLDKKDVKVLYFGANWRTDIAAQNVAGWQSAFLFEELTPGTDNSQWDFEKYWGSQMIDRTIDGNETNTLIYSKWIKQYSRVFSKLNSKEWLIFLTPSKEFINKKKLETKMEKIEENPTE